MTTKLVTDQFVANAAKPHPALSAKPARRMVIRDRHLPPAFQPNMFEDDLISALAVATENVRARQVFDWERARRQCAI
ncbi:MAG: hypothetical protein CFK52_06550 [Chloracidobacterium sp. CP2_5A]|nr:MAG: hypothetical protein CFK52_06550 [Chloracidobacterium sp. CP2_5A]